MSVVIKDFFIDFQRCIGCTACQAACSECYTHPGKPMIHVDRSDLGHTPQTTPMVCMHCKEPTCAKSCPTDAIKMDENGIVHSSLKPKCIACGNCELSCPFGIPIVDQNIQQMQKCDMCFDRTSEGLRPMCVTVCPSQALFYGTREEIESTRPDAHPINVWRFGEQKVETRVHVMVPHGVEEMIVDTQTFQEAQSIADLAVGNKNKDASQSAIQPSPDAEFL